MRTFVGLVIAFAALAHSACWAQGSLLLHWDGCSQGGTKDKFFTCDTNVGEPFVLYASLIAPDALPALQTVTFSFHVNVEGEWPASWWQTSFGACRSQAIDTPFRPSLFDTRCPVFWRDDVIGGIFEARDALDPAFDIQLYSVGAGAATQVRADGSEWVAMKITIDRTKSTGAGACSGCSLGAELVFDRCVLVQGAGRPTYVITQPAWPGANRATWNAGPPTVAANRTWGAIKALYR